MQKTVPLLVALGVCWSLSAQEVPILNYAVDDNGQVVLSVASTADHYYVLHVRHTASGPFERATALVLGHNGTTTLTEPLAAYPLDHYQVTEHLIAHPDDTDGDGTDDMAEWAALGTRSPLNAAPPIATKDGMVCVPDRATFNLLARQGGNPLSDPLELKFYIRYRDEKEPKLYFVNSNTYVLHTQFAAAIGYYNDGTLMTGSILFHPNVPAPNGKLGVYRFVFQPNNVFHLPYVQKAMELLAANLPFLKNNFCYYPLPQVGLPLYWQEKGAYDASRVSVLLEEDLYKGVDYLALHPAEGYGLLRVIGPQDVPNARDVVLYESLPNDLPRVGGILTTVTQTPLSHVNLRAIQDNLPNAFVRNALQLPAVDTLIGEYVYYKVASAGFTLRKATKQEVDAFYESLRPSKSQTPVRDLSQTRIKPLDSIGFSESTSFGVKCANVATMRTFGFPEGTIPDGFGIPFYFYDAFMQYNGFYQKAADMMANPRFQSDYQVQVAALENFRKTIKEAPMPPWMMEALADLQAVFPPGTSIRCRSSTNNEDLPGFSGAGLYDSKTQHPDEGHLSKTIKQVYASMWNFRAFDERSFYRIDHFKAAMGVLVHPNFEGERANGVGVSADPFYQTSGTYYLNTQVGEDLVTNPNALSIPEEILLDTLAQNTRDFLLINPSNQVPEDSLILKHPYLAQMRHFLGTIHRRFKTLYRAENQPGFAMEIEYKVDANGQLAIKQARPWAGFWANVPPQSDSTVYKGLHVWPNPFGGVVNVSCPCETTVALEVLNIAGQILHREVVDFRRSHRQLSLEDLPCGVYVVRGSDALGHRFVSGAIIKIK